MLSVWEERKVRLYGEHANVQQSHSQNDSGDLRGVAGGDGELGCLCGSHLCDGSAHSSGCVVNGSIIEPPTRPSMNNETYFLNNIFPNHANLEIDVDRQTDRQTYITG